MNWMEEYEVYMKSITDDIEEYDSYKEFTGEAKLTYKYGAVTARMYETIKSLEQQVEQLKKQIK